jgi:6-phosphogluconolactonase
MNTQLTRRIFIQSSTIAALTGLTLQKKARGQEDTQMQDFYVYVGTYTSKTSKGIHVYRLDMNSGELTPDHIVTGITNPSYLAISPQRNFLYSVSEVSDSQGKPTGSVSAFAIDSSNGNLRRLNHVSSEGASPCYVSVDSTGRWVLVANYSSGTIAVLPVQEDGSLGNASDIKKHTGSSVNPKRQKQAYAHCIIPSPDNRYIFAADLGTDKVMIYKFDAENGTLTENDPPFAQVKPGAGPRHFTFHPTGKLAFLIQELNSTLTSFAYDSSQGTLTEIQTVSTLPKSFTGENTCADVHVHPNGKFVYGSNRGHDSIAIFALDEASGNMEFIGHESTQGRIPRNFAIDPTGTYLFAANQNTDNIVGFQIDPESGKLTPTGHSVKVSMPVCIRMMPVSANVSSIHSTGEL